MVAPSILSSDTTITGQCTTRARSSPSSLSQQQFADLCAIQPNWSNAGSLIIQQCRQHQTTLLSFLVAGVSGTAVANEAGGSMLFFAADTARASATSSAPAVW